MITWERTPLLFLQNELGLGCGAEENFYKELDRTCRGESRYELLGRGGVARCGLPLLRCNMEQSVASPGAEPCVNVVWSQQKGGPRGLVLLLLHTGALATLFCERVGAAEQGKNLP